MMNECLRNYHIHVCSLIVHILYWIDERKPLSGTAKLCFALNYHIHLWYLCKQDEMKEKHKQDLQVLQVCK